LCRGGGGAAAATRPLLMVGTCMNSGETQQWAKPQRSGPEVKNGKSSSKDDAPEMPKDDAPEMLRCRTIQKEVS